MEDPTMDVKQTVESRFSEAAERYASSPVHAGGPHLDAMLERARLAGGERVLDLGCGPGHTALAFAARGCRVVGVDLSEAMLAKARELARARGLEGARFERADVEALPFPDGSFDVVASRFSAHHYPDPRAALREAARVLRPGGMLLLVDSVAPDDPTADTFLNAIEVVRDPSHVRDHDVREWIEMATSAGLDAERVADWELDLDFDAWIARNGATPLAARALREMFRSAPAEVRRRFGMETGEEERFSIPAALLVGVRRAAA
jgi:ubiquinone/menaquinone biosynthesis C-methylase UbiE